MRTLGLLGFCIAAAVGLSGCETAGKVGRDIADGVRSVEWPTISSAPAKEVSAAATGAGCPVVKTLPELSSLHQFADSSTTSPDKLVAESRIESLSSVCSVAGTGVTVELTLDFAGTLGPAGLKDLNGEANYTYPYFLTVVAPDGQILAKDVFALPMVYEKNNISVHRRDQLRQIIPLAAGQSAGDFQIIAGFQLSDSQLSYNKSRSGVK